jgi:hypothetical protein
MLGRISTNFGRFGLFIFSRQLFRVLMSISVAATILILAGARPQFFDIPNPST